MNDDTNNAQDQTEEQATESDLDNQIQELTARLEQVQTAKKQLMADFENFRKRTDDQKANFGLMANIQIVMQLLEIMDDLQMAIDDQNLDVDHARNMFSGTIAKLTESVSSVGVQPVEVKVGDKFDPNLMEALTVSLVEDEQLDNIVKTVVSKGYRYPTGELLRTAKVIVNKAN